MVIGNGYHLPLQSCRLAYTPACDTVMVSLPTRIVPDRAAAVLFASTLKRKGLSPFPGLPEVMCIQDTEGSAVHGHPRLQAAVTGCVTTVIVAEPPLAPNETFFEDTP